MKGKKVFKITSPYGELRGVLDEEVLLNEEVEWQVIENYCNLFNLSIQKVTRREQEGIAVWKVVAFDRDTSQVYEITVYTLPECQEFSSSSSLRS